MSVYIIDPKRPCAASSQLQPYVLVALVENGLIILLSSWTAWISSRGTIRNATPRRKLPMLLYLRCPLILFEIIWNVVGIVWLCRPSQLADCDATLVAAARLTLIGSWLMTGVLLGGFFLVFDPLGSVHHDQMKMTNQSKRIWRRRLQLIFCCAGSGGDKAKMAFEDVAELLTDFFKDTDLVLTDLWAGLLLLTNRELAAMGEISGGGELAVMSGSEPPDWMNLRTASRIMQFALGVYGWPYYFCGQSCGLQPFCDLVHQLRCCSQCRCDNVIVIKDNCCRCNTAALLLQTGLKEADLFYVNLHNEIWETPFVACLDHSTRSIVIAIRGSLSLRDAVTDLCMCEDTLELENANLGAIQVHKGMMWSARYVFSKLENEKILDDLYVLQPEYDLVITGHSLGAGVAALLSLLLKPKYVHVRCLAFSPPGCVMSENKFTEEFIFSVVIGDDLVPRLSRESMDRFKCNIMEALEQCDRAKYDILIKGCFKLFCSRRNSPVQLVEEVGENDDLESILPPERPAVLAVTGNIPSPEENPLIPSNRRTPSYTEDRFNQTIPGSCNRKLRCPGRIMHIAKAVCHTSHPSANRSYAWRNHDYFSDIWLSSSMINDHMPYVAAKVMMETARNAVPVID